MNLNPTLIKFLDMLADYLSKGIVPNIYCKNTILMNELFIFLSMDPKYLNYLFESFKKRNNKFGLRKLTVAEINKLNFKIKGAAEYFCLSDMANNECINFYIGPYDYPIKIIN
mgnify:CR=1 FL=1